jgi:hypothetical protein
MQTILQDVRYGALALARNKAFTAVAVLTLALGIGANTAIFSVVNAVLLQCVPYKDPGKLAAIGLALGLIGSLGITYFLRSQLYGVSSSDPITYATVALLLGMVALAACYLPARRATRVDPLVALRYE